MEIAMVEQSAVDAHLQRVNRFIDNVHKFQSKLDSFMTAPERTQESQMVPQQQTPVNAPMYEASATASTPTQEKITADDIDIDAILGSVNLETGVSL